MADTARMPTADESIRAAMAGFTADDIVEIDLRGGWGVKGLKSYGGLIAEEYNPRLTGQRAARTYTQMMNEDETIGGLRFIVSAMCRNATWSVDTASGRPGDREASEFVEQCMDDLEEPWADTVDEICSMLWYGFSLHGQIYKRRMGDLGLAADPARSSRYKDGRVGWLGFPIRAQDTIQRWVIDDHGRILGAEQVAMPINRPIRLPLAKSLLFRTTKHKNNPEGRSLLRSAYRSSYIKLGLQQIEAIGAERDVAGLPIMYLPPTILWGQTPENEKQREMYRKIVTGIRNDEKSGVLLPMMMDSQGHQLVKLELLAPGGSKQYDISKIIDRWDHRIAATVAGDFILLGQGPNAAGSWAMHTDKTSLFARALKVFMDSIAETINRFAIPTLMRYNSFRITDTPRIRVNALEKPDLDAVGKYLTALAAAGMPLFPNPDLEKYLSDLAGMPPPVDLEMALGGIAEDESAMETVNQPSQVAELHDELSTPGAGEGTGKDEKGQGSQAVFGQDQIAKEVRRDPERGLYSVEGGTPVTQSGKVIRQTTHPDYKGALQAEDPRDRAAATFAGHQDFTAQDHADAATYHTQAERLARARMSVADEGARATAAKQAEKHEKVAAGHRKLTNEDALDAARAQFESEGLRQELLTAREILSKHQADAAQPPPPDAT